MATFIEIEQLLLTITLDCFMTLSEFILQASRMADPGCQPGEVFFFQGEKRGIELGKKKISCYKDSSLPGK